MVGGGLVVLFLATTLPKTLQAVSPEKAFVREAGRYLQRYHKTAVVKVAAVDARVAFYAGGQFISLHGIDEGGLVAALTKSGAEYFAMESNALERQFPGVVKSPQSFGLKFEREFIGIRRDRMLIYKVS